MHLGLLRGAFLGLRKIDPRVEEGGGQRLDRPLLQIHRLATTRKGGVEDVPNVVEHLEFFLGVGRALGDDARGLKLVVAMQEPKLDGAAVRHRLGDHRSIVITVAHAQGLVDDLALWAEYLDGLFGEALWIGGGELTRSYGDVLGQQGAEGGPCLVVDGRENIVV